MMSARPGSKRAVKVPNELSPGCIGLRSTSIVHPRYNQRMPPRYIRASELGSFTFCRRAWFLERQGQPTALTQARAIGTADHAEQPHASRQAPATARLSALLLVLGVAGIACAMLLAWIRS